MSDTKTDLEMDESMETASVYKFEDRFIPLIICPNAINTSWRKSNVKQYCPDYDDGHFLYGNYYTKRFSWLRLALHFCDDTPEGRLDRIQAGKQYIDCKSREEIIDFFSSNIIALDVITEAPTLGEGSAQVLAKEETSITFSSHDKGYINYRSIGLSLSEVMLEDHWMV